MPGLSKDQLLVLDAVVELKFAEDDYYVSGRTIRKQLSDLGSATVNTLIDSLAPAYLKVNNDRPTDIYRPTLMGLLSSGRADLVKTILREIQAFLKAKFQEDADFSKYTFGELQQASPILKETYFRVIDEVISAANWLNGGGGTRGNPNFNYGTPLDIENIVNSPDIDTYLTNRFAPPTQLPIGITTPTPNASQAATVPPQNTAPNPSQAQPITPYNRGLLIFISHSSKDKTLASNLVNLLTAALNISKTQIRCSSVPGCKLPAGADTPERIRQEISTLPVFIGILTKNSVNSDYVLFELGARWQTAQPIIPLLGPNSKPLLIPEPIKNTNALRINSRTDLQQILSEISSVLAIGIQPPNTYDEQLNKLSKPPNPAKHKKKSPKRRKNTKLPHRHNA